MKYRRRLIVSALSLGCVALLTSQFARPDNNETTPAAGITASPASFSFTATVNGAAPSAKALSVTASRSTRFTAAASVQGGSRVWLSISPSGDLTTNRTITVTANPANLGAGTYHGNVTLTSGRGDVSIPVTFTIGAAPGGGTGGSYKLVGWNDLGMHCQDGQDFSVFAVLPPYNTIHAHLMDSTGRLLNSDIGYTVTYQGVRDPLTNTINTSSSGKTNFWQFAQKLGFGALAPEQGLKGFSMPGPSNTPQAMKFSSTDNTWLAEGIPITPLADSATGQFPTNYFPMMRLVAKNALGTVLASTDIVLPVSDEINCGACHSTKANNSAALPIGGGVNNADFAKDMKFNILRKHDQKFAPTPLYKAAAAQVGYNPAGLEATTSAKPVLCAQCHGSNALGLAGATGVQPLTAVIHGSHASAIDPATSQTLESSTTRESCYRCHPGTNTQCLRGAMGTLKTGKGANLIECQSCHGPMSNVAVSTRNGWLDEPNCQNCHTGTAVKNSGQIVYNSVFSSGTILRTAADQTFATNANTPAPGISLYRFSKGHGGLQCESCHGSTHAEYTSAVLNDNVQSTNLQGHTGVLSECTACHSTVPTTVNGGPHGLHPIGATWVSRHQSAAEQGRAACQACHGVDYRGTILSKTQADRTLSGRSFPKGTQIGCYSCHNGPNGG